MLDDLSIEEIDRRMKALYVEAVKDGERMKRYSRWSVALLLFSLIFSIGSITHTIVNSTYCGK